MEETNMKYEEKLSKAWNDFLDTRPKLDRSIFPDEYQKIRVRSYYKRNKEKISKQMKRYVSKNQNWLKYKSRLYYIENRDKILSLDISQNQRKYYTKKYMNDTKYNLNTKIRRAISDSLKNNKKGRRWEELVGYTLRDLINRLKRTMPKRYNWNDFLQGKLHIDHIIPKSVFNYDLPEHPDFKHCWSLKNLQLLPAEENLIKGNKLSKPLQPSLKIIL